MARDGVRRELFLACIAVLAAFAAVGPVADARGGTVTPAFGDVSGHPAELTVSNTSGSYEPNGSDSEISNGSIASNEWDLDGDGAVEQTGTVGNQTTGNGSDWPMFGNGVRNTGHNMGPGVRGPVTARWVFPTGEKITASPAVVNNTVYAGSWDGTLYAVNATSGTEQWNYSTTGPIASSSAVVNGTVYVGSYDGNLYALNATTGAKQWNYSAGGGVGEAIAVANRTVYAGSSDGTVYAVDAETGAVRWTYDNDDSPTYVSPAVADSSIYFGYWNGSDSSSYILTAVDTATGAGQWTFETPGYISPPTVSNGTVYAATETSGSNGTIRAIDAETGLERWNFTTRATAGASPAIANGTVYVGDYFGNLYALDARTGTRQWHRSVEGRIDTAAAVVNGTVYVGSDAQNVYGIDAGSGAKLWTFATRDVVSSPVAAVRGTVYAGIGSYREDGGLYALEGMTSGPRIVPFGDTAAVSTGSVAPESLAGDVRVESFAIEETSVERLRNSSVNYSVAVTEPDRFTNVTVYLRAGSMAVAERLDNVTMYLDGQEHRFVVNESAGAADETWVAFNVPEFSTRRASFVVNTSANEPPRARNESYRTLENRTLSVPAPGVLGNDSDPDGDEISLTLIEGPSRGNLTLDSDGSFTYIPDPGETGRATFTYGITDWTNSTETATVAMEITPIVLETDLNASDLPGSGTSDDPYVITSASELQAMAEDLDAHYVLGDDVDAASTLVWNDGEGFDPVGAHDTYADTEFVGEFDGAGHAVRGLTIDGSGESEIGLFGALDGGGTVKRVRLVDVNVTGGQFTGGLVGYNGGTVRQASVTGRVSGSVPVGGLVGSNLQGTIEETYANVNVTGGESVGGLAGQNFDGIVNASYATGAIHGGTEVGGLVGFNRYGTVRTSYATGPVEGDDLVGGLVGQRESSVEIDSYWDVNATGRSVSGWIVNTSGQFPSTGNGTGLTTAQMTGDAARRNMTGFDFGATWQARADEYPVLAWQRVAENERPRPRPDTYTVSENGVLSVSAPGVLENDTDPNDDALSIETSPVEPLSNGSLTLEPDGSFEYTPDHGFFGTDAFTYEVTDGSGGNAKATVTIDVEAVAVDVNVTDLAGNGTTVTPYVITNASELQAIKDDLDAHYVLGGDVDASRTADWNGGRGFRPIAAGYRTSFTGTFDGDRHTITGLTIDRAGMDDVGLFADVGVSGTIGDVTLTDVTVRGDNIVGSLVGRSEEATISHAAATEVAVSGSDEVGGLIGYVGHSTEVRYASASGTVEGSQNVGGLVGSSSGSVTRSSATGAVSGDRRLGGLVGDNLQTVRASYANVSVSGNYDLGGLVGINGGTTARSYAAGSVTGSDNLAGLVGRSTGTVRLSYATANVTRTDSSGQVAGLVAETNPDSVTGSYWDVNATGMATSTGNGSVALTTDRMTGDAARGNMTAFDFPGTWQTRSGEQPGLAWEVNDPPVVRIDSYRTVAVNASVTFDGSASSDDVRIISYEWDVDGDGAFEYTGERINHTFRKTGNATVWLRATDDDGATNSTTRRVEVVTNVPPRLNVSAPGYVITGWETPLRATASDRDGRIDAIEWDLDGDGEAERNGSSVRATFGTVGTATLVVTATDEGGENATKRVTITVAEEGAWSDTSYGVHGHPRFRVDRASTGHDPDGFGPIGDVSRDWSFGVGGRIFASPAAVNGTVYTGSYSTTYGDRVVAVDAENGSLAWEFATTKPVGGNPSVYNGTVYIGSDAGVLYALNATTGTETWSKNTGTVQPAPVVVNDTLYVPGGSNLYALDPHNGRERFSVSLGGGGSSPAVAGGTIYVGGGKAVHAIDAETGATEWTFETSGRVESSPAVVDGTVYVGSHDGRLYALDATNGFERWRFETGNRVRSSPAVANNTVYVGSDDGFVYAVDVASGTQTWAFETSNAGRGDDNRVVSSPVVAGDTVYVGTHGYYIHALDASDGTERWSYLTGYDVDATPAVVDGRVYVGSVDGNLYALSGTLPESAKRPTAEAGENLTVSENATVALDATDSTDPDGDSIGYAWTQRAGASVSLAGAGTATPTFTAPNVTNPSVLRFALTVTDGTGRDDTDQVTVVVNPKLTGVAAFNETDRLGESQVDDPGLADSIRAEASASEGVTVNLSRASPTNYSLSIDAPEGATDLTFYLQAGAISVPGGVTNLTMYLDGAEHPFTVNRSAGPGDGSWVAFSVPHFSMRTVSFESETGTTTCVAAAVAGGDGGISLTEIQAAINWWSEGRAVPDTAGKTISLAGIQSLIDDWAEGAAVACP